MIEPTFQMKTERETESFGIFTFEPLQRGFGQTLGNSLRRVLLSSLPGAAVTKVKIAGVKHLFSTVKGLKEDIVEFTLNLKKVRFVYTGEKPIKITLAKTGPGKITAADFELPSEVQVVNKDLVLGSLSDDSVHFKGDFWIEYGYGYVPFEERKTEEIGIIPLDALFAPVTRVNYKVGTTRVGRITNFDKLTMEITTDGTVAPKDALIYSAKKLSAFFEQIYEPKSVPQDEESLLKQPEKREEEMLSIEELGLPTRIANALLKVGVRSVSDLKETGPKKLSKVKNLGGKSLKIIESILSDKGVLFTD